MRENITRKVKSVAIIISPLILSLVSVIIVVLCFLSVKSTFSGIFDIVSMFEGGGEKIEIIPENVFYEVEEKDKKTERINMNDIKYPKSGELYGKVRLESVGVEANLYFSDSDYSLNHGVGQSYSTTPVGMGKPWALIGGHNNSAFNALQYLKEGDEFKISTSYGNFTYKVYKIRICGFDEFKYSELSEGNEQVVLYTCYPFTALGLTKQRCFVYAEKIDGPIIVEE